VCIMLCCCCCCRRRRRRCRCVVVAAPPPADAAVWITILSLLFLLFCHARDETDQTRYVRLGGIRFVRKCVSVKDTFFPRFIVKNDILKPMFELLEENGTRNTMTRSTIAELLSHVASVPVKPLLPYIVSEKCVIIIVVVVVVAFFCFFRSFTRSCKRFIPSFTHSVTLSFIHSVIHSHSFIHSFIPNRSQRQ
jgi:hypothetical protein